MNEPITDLVPSDRALAPNDVALAPSETALVPSAAAVDASEAALALVAENHAARCATSDDAARCADGGITLVAAAPARTAVAVRASTEIQAPASDALPAEGKAPAVIEINSVAHFESLIIGPGRVALVDFWSASCGPCGCMAPHFEAVAEEIGDALIFAKINTGVVPQLAQAFNIRSVPTVVALNGSRVVDVHVGGAQPATLRNLALRTLKKSGQPVPAHLKPTGFLRGLFGG